MSETMEMSVFVPGIPQPQGSMKAFRRGNRAIITHTKSKELMSWRGLIAQTLANNLPPGWIRTEAYTVYLRFTFDRPKSTSKKILRKITKPDTDKLLRAILDAGTGVVWIDDGHVDEIWAMKGFADASNVCGVSIRIVMGSVKE